MLVLFFSNSVNAVNTCCTASCKSWNINNCPFDTYCCNYDYGPGYTSVKEGPSYSQCKFSCVQTCTPVNGDWCESSCGEWSSCSASCGGGTQSRTCVRSCDCPTPSCGGSYCSGSSTTVETQSCNTQACCTSHASYSCYNNNIYWYDSCGNREELKSPCTCGCSGTTCTSPCCTSHASYSCNDNDVYWYNSCGTREEIKQECGVNSCDAWGGNYCKNGSAYHSRTCYNKGCSLGSCYSTPYTEEALVSQCSLGCSAGVCCTSSASYSCYKGDIYWYDSCGKLQNETKEQCACGCEGASCCGCNVSASCYNSKVYWLNSCGKMTTIKEDCGIDRCDDWGTSYCKDGDVYHSKNCYSVGCSQDKCTSLTSIEEEKVQECDTKKCTGSSCQGCTDEDGDGYSSDGGSCGSKDCNDNDKAVYPNAPEKCDAQENQCSGDLGYGKIDDGCCSFQKVEVIPLCTGILIDSESQRECLQGDTIQIKANYSSDCNFTSSIYLQIDLGSDDCSVQRKEGDLQGISLACVDNTCKGIWKVPSLPKKCLNEEIKAIAASLYSDPDYSEWLIGFPVKLSGGFKFSESYESSKCNDGRNVIDAGETCDFDSGGKPIFGNLLDGSCNQFSNKFSSGALRCLANCQIDTSNCYGYEGKCGDEEINPGETCDGKNLPWVLGSLAPSCNDYGSFRSGKISCLNCKVDTSECSMISEGNAGCGNNLWEQPEECDGADESGLDNCKSLFPDIDEVPEIDKVSCIPPGESGECKCIGYTSTGSRVEREEGDCSSEQKNPNKFIREVTYTVYDTISSGVIERKTLTESCGEKNSYWAASILTITTLILTLFLGKFIIRKKDFLKEKLQNIFNKPVTK